MQSVPISPLHYGEPKSKFGDGESIGILKEDSASGQFKVTPSDETDGNSNMRVACGTPNSSLVNQSRRVREPRTELLGVLTTPSPICVSEMFCSRRARPENRFEAAKQFSIPKKAKVKQSPFQKLQRLPVGCHLDFDHDHLCSINHLREFWYRSHGGVLVDDKERVTKTVLFTMSVWPEVCKPFLIVTPPPSLSLWEDQFNNLAPFINVVMYGGGKDKLKSIQDLEFYDNRGCTMLQVLLSHPDAILEDIQPIARIGWEAIIVDCYQNSASTYLEQLKKLSADFRLFLLSSPIKDKLSEYMKLLPFLTGEQENDNYADTTDAVLMSETKFRGHIAYERQSDPLKYLEYWVHANFARLQLGIYCSVLLANSSTLQSQTETDSIGAHCHILMSLSKCCDDPCLVGELNHNRTEL